MGLLGDIATIGGTVLGGAPGYLAGKYASNGGFRDSANKWLFGDNEQRNQALDPSNFQMAGGDYLRQYAAGQLGGVQGRQAPTAQAYQMGQAAQLNGANQDQVRQQQMGLMAQMAGVADGSQMGAGEMATRRQAGQQAAQMFAGQNMARGAGAAGAARATARGLGDLGVNAAGMSAQSALTDQANARGQLAGLMGQTRGQDLDLAGQNAAFNQQRMLQQGQFGQQTNMANQAAQLQQRGMNDQYGLGLMGQYAGVSQAELQARMARAGMFQQDSGHAGDLLQMGGTLGAAALSDRHAKTDIMDGRAAADAFLETLRPYLYRYDDAHAPQDNGLRLGIMAQDVEGSLAGQRIVRERPDGLKEIDLAAAVSALLAVNARLHERVTDLEALVEGR